MRKISKILRVEKRLKQKDNSEYFITVALVDFPEDDPRHGEEFEGYGDNYKVGQRIEAYYDDRFGKAKFND